jgi:hypothetical protein
MTEVGTIIGIYVDFKPSQRQAIRAYAQKIGIK